MVHGLQQIVDALGARLQRAATIDDTAIQLRVYSPHHGPVDDARRTSILQRSVDPEVAKWVLAQGIASAFGPVRMPANPEFGLLPRLCVPIRCQGRLLGYLFLVDTDDDPLSAEQIAEAEQAAEAAGLVLLQEQLLDELERSREREQIRDLLSGETAAVEHAAAELVEAESVLATGSVSAIVVRVHAPEAGRDDVRLGLSGALDVLRRELPPRHALTLNRADHGVVLVVGKDAAATEDDALPIARTLHQLAERAMRGGGGVGAAAGRVVVGVGEVQQSLANAHHSYRQAHLALDVAKMVPSVGDIAAWRDLGVYRTLAQVPGDVPKSDLVHPGLFTLLEDKGGAPLLDTLEAYLDHAGDSRATADELFIHRTSLYYRLNRVEQLAGVDLTNGNDRLALHVGLKVARLLGLR